jgi:hypothetical protein
MYHGCEIQKKYNQAIREGKFREIEEEARKIRRILHRDMEEIRDPEQMRGRFGEINGKYIEIREKIQENP